MSRIYLPLIALATIGMLGACSGNYAQVDVAVDPNGEVVPVRMEIGKASFFMFNVGFKVKMSDGTMCADETQLEVITAGGIHEGDFSNCPGVSYVLNVTKPINGVLAFFTDPQIIMLGIKYTADITMADGRIFNLEKD